MLLLSPGWAGDDVAGLVFDLVSFVSDVPDVDCVCNSPSTYGAINVDDVAIKITLPFYFMPED